MTHMIPVSKGELEHLLRKKHLFTPMIQTAMVVAVQSHKNQLTKDGQSYLDHHLFPVVTELIGNYGESLNENAITIATLHDVLEDDPIMTSTRLANFFPAYIVSAVELLSRPKEAKGADSSTKLTLSRPYMRQIAKADYDVRLVKLSDRMINLALIERIKNTRPIMFQEYIRETKELFLPLAKETSIAIFNRMSERVAKLEKSK